MAKSEYGREVYCNVVYYGPMHGRGEEAGGRVGMRWWEQAGIELAGVRNMEEVAAEAEAWIGINRSPLPHNQGKLPLPLFWGIFLGNFA